MRRLALLLLVASLVALSIGLYSVFSQTGIQVGYAFLAAGESETLPVGTALFSFTNSDGILVWEAGVEATVPISRGRIYVEQPECTRTALALVNAGESAAGVSFVLRDPTGLEIDTVSRLFQSGEHRALFVDELFTDLPLNFLGSLSFESEDGELAAVTLRRNANGYGEDIFATLPVAKNADQGQELLAVDAQTSSSLVFPHLGAGGGLSSQLVLINPTPQAGSGTIQLIQRSGQPLEAKIDGEFVSEFSFVIEPHGIFRSEITAGQEILTGYALLRVEQGSAPVGSVIFQFRDGDSVTSEAGVAAVDATSRARMLVDNHRTQTGVAIASMGNPAGEITFRLLDRFNQLLDTTEREVPPGGQTALFANELFPGMPDGFTGLMEIEAPFPVFPVSLKLSINERQDPILTTLPVADLTSPGSHELVVFPQLGFGSGLATRLIVLNTDAETSSSPTLSFFASTEGERMEVPLGDRFGSSFPIRLEPEEAIQLRPGDNATVSEILLDTFNPEFSEVVIDEGNTFRMRPRVIDSNGNPRDDFELTFFNLDDQVTSIDPQGEIVGKEKGFSTLRVSADPVQVEGTITVVEVNQGVDIGETSGIIQDLAGRIYLSSETENVIWRADSIGSQPEIFAGVHGLSGLRNGNREQALFNRPSYMALNQATGDLYVSDSGNHVIRRIGSDNAVITLAGTGQAGSNDGHNTQATFNNPQGLALDDQGHLWVVDSGNHTIRSIELVSGQIETIAGSPGTPGNANGAGEQARFNFPLGIALESRFVDSLGDPQKVSLVVADSRNGTIRRVFEDGQVETLAREGLARVRGGGTRRVAAAAQALSFQSPAGVAVSTSGAIVVTELETGQSKVIGNDGDLAALSQSQSTGKGVWVDGGGRALLAGASSSSSLKLGSPEMFLTSPSIVGLEGGETVTLRGRNFTADTILVVSATLLTNIQVRDTQTILFRSPSSEGGIRSLSILTRGGLDQLPLEFAPVRLDELEPGWITTVAGGATFSGEGLQATKAQLRSPTSVALDRAGNLYISDKRNHRVRKVDRSTGIILTVAGSGEIGFAGDGGPAIAAGIFFPEGIALDRAGNLFIADNSNARVRKVDAATGLISTVAGNGRLLFSGDGVLATEAAVEPTDVAVDQMGNLFIVDSGDDRVHRVDTETGIITTVAGTGEEGFSGDGGPATEAQLNFPSAVAVDATGNIFIADNRRIRKVEAATGIINTVAGIGEFGFSGDGGPALDAALSANDVTVDGEGNLFTAGSGRIRRVDATTGIITTVAGSGESSFSGDGGPALEAGLSSVGLALDGVGNIFVADIGNHRIRKVNGATGIVTTTAGNGESGFSGDGGPAFTARLDNPFGISFDRENNLFIADQIHNSIRRVDRRSGIITTVAGNETSGFSGDGGEATEASLRLPDSVAVDQVGNIYVADTFNHRIRRVDGQTRLISTLAGRGVSGFSGDGGPAAAARLRFPSSVAVGPSGDVFFADNFNHRIRKVDVATGTISTIAGTGDTGTFAGGFSGDGGSAIKAELKRPTGVAVNESGDLWIADLGNSRIRMVDHTTGAITTVAGTGESGFSGDGGPAIEAQLQSPWAVAVDDVGNLFIVDRNNHRIRMVDAATKVITTVAGIGESDFFGDGGPAVTAAFGLPSGVAIDSRGNLFLSDTLNGRIRAVRGPIVGDP